MCGRTIALCSTTQVLGKNGRKFMYVGNHSSHNLKIKVIMQHDEVCIYMYIFLLGIPFTMLIGLLRKMAGEVVWLYKTWLWFVLWKENHVSLCIFDWCVWLPWHSPSGLKSLLKVTRRNYHTQLISCSPSNTWNVIKYPISELLRKLFKIILWGHYYTTSISQ